MDMSFLGMEIAFSEAQNNTSCMLVMLEDCWFEPISTNKRGQKYDLNNQSLLLSDFYDKCSHIKVKEPFWLLRRSHCSVINLAPVGEPFVAPQGAILDIAPFGYQIMTPSPQNGSHVYLAPPRESPRIESIAPTWSQIGSFSNHSMNMPPTQN